MSEQCAEDELPEAENSTFGIMTKMAHLIAECARFSGMMEAHRDMAEDAGQEVSEKDKAEINALYAAINKSLEVLILGNDTMRLQCIEEMTAILDREDDDDAPSTH